MDKMKKIILSLFFILVVTACQQAEVSVEPGNTFTPPATTTETLALASMPAAFPRSELSPYYGEPQPAKIIVNGETYDSEIGTTMWITEVHPDGSTAMVIGDAFAIITPIEPIITTSSFSLTLELPIPINPTELWYALFKVSEKELDAQDSTYGAFAWNPDYKTQTHQEQTYPPLLPKQQLTFSFEPGIYVFEVHAGWGGAKLHTELEADFGFLFEVQE